MADHGTRSGYQDHLRKKTEPCDECRVANKEHSRRRREFQRETKPDTPVSRDTWDMASRLAADQRMTIDEFVRRAIRLFPMSSRRQDLGPDLDDEVWDMINEIATRERTFDYVIVARAIKAYDLL